MPQIADRDTLQAQTDELVPGLKLVLVEARDGRMAERSRCFVEKVEGTDVLLSHGGTLTLGQMTDGYNYFYVPEARWQCWITSAPARLAA